VRLKGARAWQQRVDTCPGELRSGPSPWPRVSFRSEALAGGSHAAQWSPAGLCTTALSESCPGRPCPSPRPRQVLAHRELRLNSGGDDGFDMRGGELAAGSDADSLALGLDLVVHRGEKVDDWEGNTSSKARMQKWPAIDVTATRRAPAACSFRARCS